jgi:GAF domain-containing protein
MDKIKKEGRYLRIYEQLSGLLTKTTNPEARMATLVAVLHHKFNYYFWTGFYCLIDGELIVRTYQGPVACQVLAKNKGVCWAGINTGQTQVVEDVHLFPGHIACDSRSKSEVVVPLRQQDGSIVGVLDVDSDQVASFDEVDAKWLEKIVQLVYNA